MHINRVLLKVRGEWGEGLGSHHGLQGGFIKPLIPGTPFNLDQSNVSIGLQAESNTRATSPF